MAAVELLENHQSLYKRGGIIARIEDNGSHGRSEAAGVSPIFVRKRWSVLKLRTISYIARVKLMKITDHTLFVFLFF